MTPITRVRLWHLIAPLLLSVVPLILSGCALSTAGASGPERVNMAELPGDAGESLLGGLLPQMSNHIEPDGPLFKGDYAPDSLPEGPDMLVVSYNLRYGEAITETIRAFREVSPLPAADIILMQEMDEEGVRLIAGALGYNFVYYPASVAEDGDNFGNAILARWPISDPNKVILPGLNPLTGQQRTATRATVTIDGIEALVYSTHVEVATAPPSLRQEQFAAILADVPPGANHVIVGGDFNTVTGRGVGALAGMFGDQAFEHATGGLGPTYTRFGLEPSATDHIFTRGFARQESGVIRDIVASDHFPVWARFARPSTP